MPRPKSS
eukprot:jgi/Astpho2/9028/gw1.00133.194.1_t